MRFLCARPLTAILLCVAAGAAATQESPLVVCLSNTDQVALSFTFPERRDIDKVVILDHVGREVLLWISPCNITIKEFYDKRVRWSCDPTSSQLGLTLMNVTSADNGTLQCKDGALNGPVLPGCLTTLDVIGLEDLSQVCSYSSSNRTVFCERVSQEVKVYRIGQVRDRDLFYFSEPFHYILGRREYGQFAVARTRRTREDELCSRDYTFHVEGQTRDAVERPSTGMSTFDVIYLSFVVLALVTAATLVIFSYLRG